MHEFFHDVVLHALEECARLLPFLFLTYLLMEWLEHRASERTTSLLSRAGRFAPPLGALLGVVPQCGFSTVASNLYSARLVTAGTLVAVFHKALHNLELFSRRKVFVKFNTCVGCELNNAVLREIFNTATIVARPFVNHSVFVVVNGSKCKFV